MQAPSAELLVVRVSLGQSSVAASPAALVLAEVLTDGSALVAPLPALLAAQAAKEVVEPTPRAAPGSEEPLLSEEAALADEMPAVVAVLRRHWVLGVTEWAAALGSTAVVAVSGRAAPDL